MGTVGGGLAGSVSNGVLRLQTEQECGGEVVDAVDTRGVVARRHHLCVRKMCFLQITMDPEEKMPNTSKKQPGEEKACKEDQKQVSPLEIH